MRTSSSIPARGYRLAHTPLPPSPLPPPPDTQPLGTLADSGIRRLHIVVSPSFKEHAYCLRMGRSGAPRS